MQNLQLSKHINEQRRITQRQIRGSTKRLSFQVQALLLRTVILGTATLILEHRRVQSVRAGAVDSDASDEAFIRFSVDDSDDVLAQLARDDVGVRLHAPTLLQTMIHGRCRRHHCHRQSGRAPRKLEALKQVPGAPTSSDNEDLLRGRRS